MIRAIHKRLDEREEGFTLIELLVVVIIIGILAAIAIPVFLNQRERAWDAAVESDLRNAAIGQETFFTDNAAYTEDLADLTADDIGFNASADVVFDNDAAFVTDYTGAAAAGYCMEAHHVSNAAKVFFYSSDNGAPEEGTCP